jgi:enoyl-[acyl-carrier protein] reductase I
MADSQSLMAGKRGIIMGVANDRSIAWGIARVLAAHGAELAFSYQAPQLERRVKPLAESVGSSLVIECDAASDASLDGLFTEIAKHWDGIDFVVHAVAFSDRTELTGKYVNTSRKNFQLTLDVSCYTLTAVCQRAVKYMAKGGSIVTLTYYGAERVMPHYNVMGVAKAALESCVRYLAADLGPQGIRVNAISAGPLRTLSSAGITGFKSMLHHHQERAPLKRNTAPEEVAAAALYLCSELGAGVTGEVLHVDAGYNIVGM